MTGLRANLVFLGAFAAAQWAASPMAQDWPHYGGSTAGTRYTALDQINRGNVHDLEVAWIYQTGEMARRDPGLMRLQAFQNTPSLVDGSLIVCSPFSRISALDPATGQERWVFDAVVDTERELPGMHKCRGVTQWLDGEAGQGAHCRRRIYFATTDRRLMAIDSKTGTLCPDFGDGGTIRINPDKELLFPGEVQLSTPPGIVNGVLVQGSMIIDNLRADAPSGKVRAYDARSGAALWEYDAIPRDRSDPAYATWGKDSAAITGHANVWTVMSVDEERDLVFLPTTSPSPDFYGGERPGENRWANSLIALRGATGEVAWSFQVTHHDVWDYDHPAQPLLIDLPHGGVLVPAVVLITKQGFIFTFNRETGEPLFPIEERPVPQVGVPGEWLSPTQPFPLAPPPIVKTSVTPGDAWGFTFVDRWYCRRKIESLRHGGFYTPPSLEGTILPAAYAGGPNWGGGAFDPERNILVVSSLHVPGVVRLVPKVEGMAPPEISLSARGVFTFEQAGTPYRAENFFLLSIFGAPCTPPPWGRLTGIDLAEGTMKWQVALGSIENDLPLPIPWELGTPGAGGAMITAGGLAFIAAAMDEKFRAFDSETGEKLWQVGLPAGGNATPMSYEAAGRQFVVLAAGGHPLYETTPGDYVIAYALPE